MTEDQDEEPSITEFDRRLPGLKVGEAKQMAEELCRTPFHWDCESLRTQEGYYRVRGGIEVSGIGHSRVPEGLAEQE